VYCSVHPNQPAVGYCQSCGGGLCYSCFHAWNPPTCQHCANVQFARQRSGNRGILVAAAVLFVIGVLFGLGSNSGLLVALAVGYVLAGFPAGWASLGSLVNRRGRTVFLILPIVGWLLLWVIRFALSPFVGIVALPIRIVAAIKGVKKADKALHG